LLCKNEYAFPIDIDEFIAFYNKNNNQISCNNETIHAYIKTLPRANAYKMNYIWSKNLSSIQYERAAVESTLGTYKNYDLHAKTFFHSTLFKGKLDQGQHYHTTDYCLTNLCLVHYHCRNLIQMKKKIYNNIAGFGYPPFDLNKLKQIIKQNPTIEANHHIKNQIKILENTFTIPNDTELPNDINLSPLSKKILSIR
jgi:hypothetical protein